MIKSYSKLYDEYCERYNNKPKHDFSDFLVVSAKINHHRILIRPQLGFNSNIL